MKRTGFTLLEVLVALAVIAIALVGAVKLTGQTSDGTRALEQRIHARWVAQNHLALAQATRAWPEPGSSAGEANMSGERFMWAQTITATPNPNFRKLDIEVRADDAAEPLIRLTSLLVRPGL